MRVAGRIDPHNVDVPTLSITTIAILIDSWIRISTLAP